MTNDKLREALLRIAGLNPVIRDSTHGPRWRCRHCGYAWMPSEHEQHDSECAFEIARAALAAPVEAEPLNGAEVLAELFEQVTLDSDAPAVRSLVALNAAFIAKALRQTVEAEPVAQSDLRAMWESAMRMIGNIQHALGISDEDAACATGDEEILYTISELKDKAGTWRKAAIELAHMHERAVDLLHTAQCVAPEALDAAIDTSAHPADQGKDAEAAARWAFAKAHPEFGTW